MGAGDGAADPRDGAMGGRSPGHDPTLPLSGVSIMLSFTAMLDAERAKGFAGTVAFRFGEMVYVARVQAALSRYGAGQRKRARR